MKKALNLESKKLKMSEIYLRKEKLVRGIPKLMSSAGRIDQELIIKGQGKPTPI